MQSINRIRRLTVGLALVAIAAPVLADKYPSRPIRLIVPYAAGGSTDQLARVIQQPLSEVLGQPVIVENKPGAGGTIGVVAVAKAEPDGYTLVFGNTGPNGVVSLMRKVPYDLQKDLRPISNVVIAPMILAVRSDIPAKTVKEFLAYAKQQGSKLNYGSVGNGSLSHLTGEYFNHTAGTQLVHIPYNGGAPMMTAFLGGDLHAAFVTGLDGAALLQTGKVRYIGVGTVRPSEAVPGVPTIAADVPGFKSTAWFGVLGPKGLPDPIVDKLHTIIAEIIKRPDVRQKFIERKVEPHGSTPQELANIIKGEQEQWAPVVKQANIVM